MLYIMDFLIGIFFFLLLKKQKGWRWILLLLLPVFLAQYTCCQFTDSFIPPLAFSNTDSYNIIGLKPYCIFAVLTVLTLAAVYFIPLTVKNRKINFSLLCALLIYTFASPTSYMFSFGKSSYAYVLENTTFGKIHAGGVFYKITPNTLNDLSGYINFQSGKKYNVVVIFTEGMSKRIISPELTPNILEFSRNDKIIDFENYFNHTAATFRGLAGQMSSSFTMRGGYYSSGDGLGQINKEQFSGYGKNVTFIPDILKPLGYYTAFNSSQNKNGNLTLFLKTFRFDKVFFKTAANSPDKWIDDIRSNRDNYHSLQEEIQSFKQPFFAGIYPVGTHVGLDSVYSKYGDGKNPLLNKFHEMDNDFGNFWKFFKNNPLAENTILIFTADHATYPEKEFKETFSSDNSVFCDEIPLFIYHPDLKQRTIIDAGGATSLSFAPTLLDLLQIPAETTFLGKSLFNTTEKDDINYVYAAGGDYSYTKNCKPEPLKNSKLKKLVRKYQNAFEMKMIKNSKYYTAVRDSGLFDSRYYLENNLDVRNAGIDPLEHFLEHGWKERRNPSAVFSVNKYFEAYPDVLKADINPLLHYLYHGKNEGRTAFPVN